MSDHAMIDYSTANESLEAKRLKAKEALLDAIAVNAKNSTLSGSGYDYAKSAEHLANALLAVEAAS